MNPPLKVHVAQKRQVAESIVLLDLRAVEGGQLPSFTAGAHITIDLPGGISRAYSLCNDPEDRTRYQVAVLREPSSTGGSIAVHNKIAQGDELVIAGPFNHFKLDETAPHTILLAGGIGITPLLAMAYRLHKLGASWELHYGARTSACCAFQAELEDSPFSSRVHLYFSDVRFDQRLDAVAILGTASKQSHVYVCGPSGLIDHVLTTGRAYGLPEDQLHYERFSAQPRSTVDVNRAFKLRLARSGLILEVPTDRSVIDVLLDANVEVPVSCEQGVCGTCITGVIDGLADHRDQCLSTAERARSFTPCCSRSLTEALTIDL